jgi:uncharacterized membrane protein
MRSKLNRWYPVLLVLIAAAISLSVLPRLPERMPVHWDFQGNANGWMPRALGAFFAPVLIVVMWGILSALPSIDPRRENYSKFKSTYDTTVAAVLSLLFATHLIVLAIALGYQLPVRRIISVLVGLSFLVVGNVLPRARSNFMFGIRTPWTLSSERVWASTHRLAGYTMTAAGLGMIIAGLVLPVGISPEAMLVVVAGAILGPAAYSYFIWRREAQQ